MSPTEVEFRSQTVRSWVVGPHLVELLDGKLRLIPDQAPADQSVVIRAVASSAADSSSRRVMSDLRPSDLLREAGLCGRPIVVSGHQPSYHPYIPLLCKAAAADVFVFADDMAFGRQKFQHRQRLPVEGRSCWATLPVVRSQERARIAEKRLDPASERLGAHWRLLQRAFGGLPHFALVGDFYEQVYAASWHTVAEIDYALWIPLALLLCPEALCWNSSSLQFDRSGRKGDRIAAELRAVAPLGGTYLAGGAAGYLHDSSEQHPDLTYKQVIERAGFEILRPYIDEKAFGERTSTGVSSTAVELIAREGHASAEILRSSTRFGALPQR